MRAKFSWIKRHLRPDSLDRLRGSRSTDERSAMGGFHKLPLELLQMILENLPGKDLKSARLVCRTFRSSVNSHILFRHVSLKFPKKFKPTPLERTISLMHYYYPTDSLFKKTKYKRILEWAIQEYMSIFLQLRSYDSVNLPHHITVRTVALLALTEALTQVRSYDLSELTIYFDKSQFDDDLMGKMISQIHGRTCLVFRNVKRLTVIINEDPLHSLYSFLQLDSFAAKHTSNIESLRMETELEKFAFRSNDPLGGYQHILFNGQCWNRLHKLHFTNYIVQINHFADFIHRQPVLEVVLLEKVNMISTSRIPMEFNYSAWKWFFSTFGRADSPFFYGQIKMILDKWANTRFYVDQLTTEAVYEDIDSWNFRNVMKLSDYIEDEEE